MDLFNPYLCSSLAYFCLIRLHREVVDLLDFLEEMEKMVNR